MCGAPCLNLAGTLPIPAMAAAIARLALLLTNDSGPAHIAYALGTPAVTVFTTTNPREWGPLDGAAHRVVVARRGPIAGPGAKVERVVEAAGEILRAA